MSAQKSCFGSPMLIYLQCYFLTIAQILGTGVLGLPVTLAESGLSPFIITFTIALILQIMSVYLVVDLLQKASVASNPLEKRKGTPSDHIPLTASALDDSEEDDSSPAPAVTEGNESPDLHCLAETFLPRVLVHMFDIHMVIKLSVFLISYALAGSEAWADLLNINLLYVIPVFCWVLILVVVFAQRFVMPVVSILTFIKGSLLLGTVIVAFIVGSTIQHEIHNDFEYIAKPFLMGTVALGGVQFILPYMFTKISKTAPQIKGLRLACILAITTCYLLNIFWCWAVLKVVPQVDSCSARLSNGSSVDDFHLEDATPCLGTNITLLSAKENGLISTIPFKQVLHDRYSQYSWVGMLVTQFIIVSISISFLVTSSVLCHTVEGWLKFRWGDSNWRFLCIKQISSRYVIKVILCLTILSLIFTVAMLNPKSFVKMLEKGASLLLNIYIGFYLGIMIFRATGRSYRTYTVPVPLSRFQVQFKYFYVVYFNFAVLYDILSWILDAALNTDVL